MFTVYKFKNMYIQGQLIVLMFSKLQKSMTFEIEITSYNVDKKKIGL
jgi:hypothetical protein